MNDGGMIIVTYNISECYIGSMEICVMKGWFQEVKGYIRVNIQSKNDDIYL